MANYGTVNGGDTYFNERIGGTTWSNATATEKQQALVSATELIDSFNFFGKLKESGQELKFPRAGQTAVPTAVEQATYLIADRYLNGETYESKLEELNVIKRKFLSAETEYDTKRTPTYQVTGIPDPLAFKLLRPFLRDKFSFQLYRV